MPRPSRRALLELLGAGTATLLAGCRTGSPTETPSEGSNPNASPTGTPTAIASETESETPTATETPGEVDCTAVSRPEAAWPVPRRSPARDGYVADPDGFEDAPAFGWEAEPSAPEDSYASPSFGQPVVDRDGLYLTNHLDKGPERPTHGHVHALDPENGDRRWASERLRSPSHPVLWGDLVVVVAENEDLHAMVVAFDQTDGTHRWTREFAARDGGFVSAGDHLYLALEEDSDRGTVRTLAEDGSTVWSRQAAFADHVNEGPAVGTDNVYAVTREGRLHALDRDDGTTRWTHRFQDPMEQRPFASDLVVTDCSTVTVVEGVLKAVDDDGDLIWEVAGDHGTVVTDGETIYVGTDLDGNERELRALSAATGDVCWKLQRDGAVFGSLVVAGDAVFVRFDESIRTLERADGTERWRTDRVLSDIALADGTLYGTTRGTLLALR